MSHRPRPALAVAFILTTLIGVRPHAEEGAHQDGDAPEPTVKLDRKDGVVMIEASLPLEFDRDDVWSVVLDYDGLSGYMPNVDSSRVVTRSSRITRVRQVAHVQFIFRKTYRFQVEFERVSPDSVTFRRVKGDLLGYHGSWATRSNGSGVRLVYHGIVDHGLGVPWFLGKRVLRRSVRDMMPAIRDELGRRHIPPPEG